MAAKSMSVNIEGNKKVFQFKELTVRQIMDVFDVVKEFKTGMSFQEMFGLVESSMATCSNVTLEDLQALAPSELEQLWTEFKGVNSSFFKMARTLGMDEMITSIRAALVSEFYNLLSTAPAEATKGVKT